MTGGERADPWTGAGRDSALEAQHRPESAAGRLLGLDDATTIQGARSCLASLDRRR